MRLTVRWYPLGPASATVSPGLPSRAPLLPSVTSTEAALVPGSDSRAALSTWTATAAGPGTTTWTPITARTTWVTAKLPPAEVGWTSSKAMPARWSPAAASLGTLTVKVTGRSLWGATVTVPAAVLTQAPAFVTWSCRLPYTAPDVGAVRPSTPETASSTGPSPVLVTMTWSVKVSPGAALGLK